MTVPPIILYCAIAFLLAIIAEFVIFRTARRFFSQLALLAVVVVVAVAELNDAPGHLAFGADEFPAYLVVCISVATLLGIGAHYFFYFNKGAFSWLELLKPMAVSPIVIHVFMSDLRSTGDLRHPNVFFLCLVGFENGFFCKAILQGGNRRTATRTAARHG